MYMFLRFVLGNTPVFMMYAIQLFNEPKARAIMNGVVIRRVYSNITDILRPIGVHETSPYESLVMDHTSLHPSRSAWL